MLRSLILTLFILPAQLAVAQPELTNWFFGDGIQVTFGGNGPVLGPEASLSASGLNQPACISDASGNPVLYTDGAGVYNAAGDLIQNGNFTQASENMFVPDPGNPDRYYLFQSGNSGLKYSIVTMSLNGGQGGINDNEKNIALNSFNCQLACAGHSDEDAFWIVSAHNNNGASDDVAVLIYSLTNLGVTLASTFEQFYFFGGWFLSLDDMRLSPDCSKIGLVFKGHYLVLMRLNNSTGQIFDPFPTAMDIGTNFNILDYIEFSPSSEYLWSLGDNSGLMRYSLADWSPDALSISQETLLPPQWNGNTYSDLRLGPDGALYLQRPIDNAIDRIPLPDAPFADLIVESNVLTAPSGFTNKFPNLPNLSCLPPSIALTITHEFECLEDSTLFNYFSSSAADSLLWNFGDPASGALNLSEDEEPFHIFSSTGTFTVTLTLWADGESQQITHDVTIYEAPEFDLGPDQEICQGETITFNTGLSAFDHEWNTGATTTFINVSINGEYSVEVRNGSCLRSDAVNVTIIPELFLSLIEPPAECENDPVTLNGVIGFSDGFSWNTGETTPSITVTESGTYTLSAFNSCFSGSVSATVTFVNLPDNFLGGDRVGCAGDSVLLSSSFSEGNYIWNTGQSGSSIYITESGTYSVTLNYLGCLRSDEVAVDLLDYVPVDEIVMPNIFTPNGDSRNTSFRPFLPSSPEQDLCELSVLDVDLSVYNRWGGLLTEEGDCEWRGAYNNNDLPEGTYYFIVNLKSVCRDEGGERRIEGHFTLLRD